MIRTSLPLNCEPLEDRALMSASPLGAVGLPAPMPQTREHILLARQVGVPAASLTKVGTGHLILPIAISGDNVWRGPITMDHSGPMPRTREHILLARQVGVPAAVVGIDSRPGSGILKAADDYFGETAMPNAGRVRVSSGSSL